MLRGLLFASAAFIVASCTSSSTSLLNPATSRCVATLAADLMTPEASGGTGQLTVGVNRECQWTARADVDWISVSPSNGQGEASLTYTVAANPAGVQRRGGLIVNDNRLEVAQRAASCAFTLSRTGDSFDAAGGTRTISVAAPAACAWEASSAAPWLVVAGSGGSGAGSLEFRVEANATPSPRTGTMTVAGQTFTVTQAAASSSSCPIVLSPGSQSIVAAAATGSVSVSAPAGCAWTAASDAGWLTITSGLSGTGTGSVAYAAAANTAPLTRTATISIGNQAFTLIQNAAGAPCVFTVSPLSFTVGSAGGVSTVAITVGSSSCTWSAASNTSWIALNGPSAGSGTSQLSFTVAANTSASPRSSSVSVAGETVSVSQAAAQAPAPPPTPPAPPVPCTFTLSATTQSIPAGGGQRQISVTASASTCTWVASTATSWISISSGLSGTGNGTVTFAAPANTSTIPRTGTLTIADATVTITQPELRLNLDGKVSGLSGSCPNLTFKVNGQTVHTNNATDFGDERCSRVRNGDKVDVEGAVQADNSVLASRVSLD